jgi:hypothetical protein
MSACHLLVECSICHTKLGGDFENDHFLPEHHQIGIQGDRPETGYRRTVDVLLDLEKRQEVVAGVLTDELFMEVEFAVCGCRGKWDQKVEIL